jgi:hypothetical protein
MYMSVLSVCDFDGGGKGHPIKMAHNAGPPYAYDAPVFKKKMLCAELCILKTGYCGR